MLFNTTFVGERTHPEDEEGINRARYIFAQKYADKKDILDVGCGGGYGSAILAKTAKSVLGIDLSKEVIVFAKNNHKNKNLKFQVGDATKLNKKKKFHIITAFEIIEHIFDDSLFLDSLKELLSRKGTFLISTPNKLISSPNSNKPDNPYHVREYTPDQFKKLLKRHFKNVVIYGISLREKEKREIEKSVNRSLKLKLAIWLGRSRVIRYFAGFVPRRLRRILSGENNLRFKTEDYKFQKTNINKSPFLFGIVSDR